MRDHTGILRATQGIVATMVLAVAFSAHAARDSEMVRTEVVRTADGPVRGFVSDGVSRFLGIPYAAPPVGNLRWRPPQPPAPWDKPKDTVEFGNSCPQTATLAGFAAESDTEDCLYLNVFAPAEGNERARPVMVWIHGGGFYVGRSDDYDGSMLVKKGDVVVVTINYRLNVFGFLALPALDTEGHAFANYGLMDQQFALEWVQRNIAAFGGDPRNVTIFGQSSGGRGVFAHMISPTAKGLFHRAIVQSGSLDDQLDLATAQTMGKAFARAVGCPNETASCLRALSVQEIQAQAGEFNTDAFATVDGTVLTQTRQAAFESGDFNRVPVINGTNRDERRWRVAIAEVVTGKALTADRYPALIKDEYGENGAAVLTEYSLSDYNSPSAAFAAAQGSSGRICPELEVSKSLSQFVPVFMYEFADRTAPSYLPPVSFPYGAYHTGEIQYLFPLYHGASGTPHPLNPVQQKLSDIMVAYWAAFAESGNPNSDSTPDWPQAAYPFESGLPTGSMERMAGGCDGRCSAIVA